ncbi:conserved hypothetical protein [Methanosalsum zhilinae DSM 4017]|uniref:PPC domain-containing protein n=1 Tax=Methanosalsum zhilinae (strain DSM 4017 / NBRC 107636 / OCM 62 / WeN5) TaxID=679901 RepID=F7XPE2_METZD|nr:DUF296 domain-containing protein [Methanosalsum zhilinae]AEH60270.1 conserved hypothetical protein [Methanosalsum zhilinae DSM 4017]
MKYSKATQGRIFIVRMDHGDDIIEQLKGLALEENIRSAFFIILGAAEQSTLVTGPKEPLVPPETVQTMFNDVGEIIGGGNIMMQNNEPLIHLHTAIGNSRDVKVGCMRDTSRTFMTAEIFIMELDDITVSRKYDNQRGFSPIEFNS